MTSIDYKVQINQHPLLQSNSPLSKDDCARVRGSLTENEQTISELEAKIAQLKADNDAYRRLLAPHRNIPEDIIRAIMLMCVSDLNACGFSSKEVPLVLAHVCTRWRTIALNTGALWSKIKIVLSRRASTQKEVQHRLNIWSIRSRQTPLELYINFGYPSYDSSDDSPLRECFNNCLRPLAPRVRHLTIVGAHLAARLPNSIVVERDAFPELRSVIIQRGYSGHEWGDEEDEPIPSLDLFPGSTKLRIADITGLRNKITLPDGPLEMIYAHAWRKGAVARVLEAYPNLRHASFSEMRGKYSDTPSTTHDSSTRQAFPKIQSLSLDYSARMLRGPEAITFETIDFPSLTTLHVKAADPRLSLGSGSIMTWYTHEHTKRALGNLTSLDLDIPLSLDHITSFLACAPKVRNLHLVLNANSTGDELMDTLTLSTSEKQFVPLLEELEFQCRSVSRGAIHNMISSRTTPDGKSRSDFRRLRVYGNIKDVQRSEFPAIPRVEVTVKANGGGMSPWRKTLWTEWRCGLEIRQRAMDEDDSVCSNSRGRNYEADPFEW